MRKLNIVFAMACACALALVMLAGCGAQSSGGKSASMQAPSASASSASASSASAAGASASSASVSASASASASKTRVVGNTQDNGASFEVTNTTGKVITSISVKSVQDAEWPPNLLGEGETIAVDEKVTLACPAIAVPQAAEGEGRDVALRPMADIRLVFDDGSEAVLHQLYLDQIAAASLLLGEGGLAFLEYSDSASGGMVSTLEAEQAVRDSEQQAANEQAANNNGAGASNEEPVYYEEPVQYSEPVYTDNSAVGGGNEDACVDDIVLR